MLIAALVVLVAAGVGVGVGVGGVFGPSGSASVGLALRGGDYGPAGAPRRVQLVVSLVNTGRSAVTVTDFGVRALGLRLVSIESDWPATSSDPYAYRITPSGAARLTLRLAVACSGAIDAGSLRLETTRGNAGPRSVSLALPATLPSPTGSGRSTPLSSVLRKVACHEPNTAS